MGRAAYLYVIGGRTGPHKVGVSGEPVRRLRELQVGSPTRLRLKRVSEAPVDDAERVETYVHFLLSESAIRGEWFKVTEEAAWVALTAAIEAVAAGLDVPEPLPAEPRKRGRPLHQHEPAYIRFKPGTKARVEAVLHEGETHASFVNEAVDEKIARRLKPSPSRRPKPKADPDA